MYVLILPAMIFSLIFCYQPMYGAQIAFRDYKFNKGILGSDWVGMKYFIRFWSNASFWRVLTNTLWINLCTLLASFPLPIVLALMLNEVRSIRLRKGVQMITYMPHFLSTVSICGLTVLFTNKDYGVINLIIQAMGGTPRAFMTEAGSFVPIYAITDIWQNLGWNSIIYVAALTSVDPGIVEAAEIDGVSRLQKIWYIDLPCILPTIIILLIMKTGQMMNIGYEKVLLLQNSLNMSTSDVISTYVYRLGIEDAQFSYTTAIGLFNSVVNVLILVAVNKISSRLGETSLW